MQYINDHYCLIEFLLGRGGLSRLATKERRKCQGVHVCLSVGEYVSGSEIVMRNSSFTFKSEFLLHYPLINVYVRIKSVSFEQCFFVCRCLST